MIMIVEDLDLDLGGTGSFLSLALLAFLPSSILFFCKPKIRRGTGPPRAPPLDLPLNDNNTDNGNDNDNDKDRSNSGRNCNDDNNDEDIDN